MKAIEFIKKFGWDLAQRDIAALESGFIKKEDFLEHYGFDILDDLKRYVDAWELVQKSGGLDEAKDHTMVLALIEEYEQLKQLRKSIHLVEEVGECNE